MRWVESVTQVVSSCQSMPYLGTSLARTKKGLALGALFACGFPSCSLPN